MTHTSPNFFFTNSSNFHGCLERFLMSVVWDVPCGVVPVLPYCITLVLCYLQCPVSSITSLDVMGGCILRCKWGHDLWSQSSWCSHLDSASGNTRAPYAGFCLSHSFPPYKQWLRTSPRAQHRVSPQKMEVVSLLSLFTTTTTTAGFGAIILWELG